jgi:lipopolysaccharide export LptBFGC system permease protein LptF
MLKLYNGNIHSNSNSVGQYQKINFSEYKLYLKIDEGADNATIKPRMIPYHDLQGEIDRSAGQHRRELKSEFWRRYAVAFTPFVFVFLGIGYGTVRTRAVRSGAALVALLVIVIYWGVQAGSTILAQKGILPPALAMQLSNIVMILISIPGFRTATW